MFEGWLPRDDNGFTRSEEKIMLLSFSDQGRKYFQFREALKKNPDMFKEFKLSKLQVIVTTSKILSSLRYPEMQFIILSKTAGTEMKSASFHRLKYLQWLTLNAEANIM